MSMKKRVNTEAPGFSARLSRSLDAAVIWRYGGKAYRLDMNDADDAERYYACVKDMERRQLEAPKAVGHAEGIRACCARTRLFFDALLGEGAGLAIVGQRDCMGSALKACAGLYAHVAGQGDAFAEAARSVWETARRREDPAGGLCR